MMQRQDDPIIRLRGVSKRFGTVQAVDAVSLDVRRGEFFALVGPSGCGKTSLLRMLAGFETPDAGSIEIDGQDMNKVEARNRPVNLVFQSYAVFPHMSVAQNVGYGLKISGCPRDDLQARVDAALRLVKLEGQEAKMPDTLSGGQRQRVALARALVLRPAVLLLDEPLSALDAKLREAMQLELVHLQKTVGITFVIVTHDQSEALSMADRIAVMQAGAVRQVASPSQLYDAPACRFVADFIGRINLFEAVASSRIPGRIRINSPLLGGIEREGSAEGPVTLAVRPEKIQLSRMPAAQPGWLELCGTLTGIAYFGGYCNVYVDIGAAQPLMAQITNAGAARALELSVGGKFWCSWRSEDTLLLMD